MYFMYIKQYNATIGYPIGNTICSSEKYIWRRWRLDCRYRICVSADTFEVGSSPHSWTLEEREEYSSTTNKASLFKERNVLRRQQLEDVKKEYANFKSQSENLYENTDYAQKKLRANADDLHDRLSKKRRGAKSSVRSRIYQDKKCMKHQMEEVQK